ncbi:hypothetical protein [Actinoplanes sp. NPDC051859]|uniref:hypothetical protein n=1 Tax=Actinoplanes sp. NPDC051859 TaxID=3363909 RepID=UPI0037AE5EED
MANSSTKVALLHVAEPRAHHRVDESARCDADLPTDRTRWLSFGLVIVSEHHKARYGAECTKWAQRQAPTL